jgi:hypothetical protein
MKGKDFANMQQKLKGKHCLAWYWKKILHNQQQIKKYKSGEKI